MLDQARISYRVLAPVRLQVTILDKQSVLVRSFSREDSDIGSQPEIVLWSLAFAARSKALRSSALTRIGM